MKIKSIATKMFEVIPPFMSFMRAEVRNCAGDSLSIPQFRVLANINRGINHVVDIAFHHGVSQPSMTKLVNNLVERGLIHKEHDSKDRRLINLYLTNEGRQLFTRIRKQANEKISIEIDKLSKADQEELAQSLLSIETILNKIKADKQ